MPVPGTTVTLKLPDCRNCKHYRETTLFELCTHTAATYTAAGKTGQHTIGHMRGLYRGLYVCGPDARLFEPLA